MMSARALLAVAAMSAGCATQDTGGTIVDFHAYAAGVAEAKGNLEFTTQLGFRVRLAAARMHIGAVYLRLGQSNPGSANSSCVGDTTYGLQVPGPVDVDLLDARLQEFSVLGSATDDLNLSGEVWLSGGESDGGLPTGGAINDVHDSTVLVSATGTAVRDGASYPFATSMTISSNRLIPPSNPAVPGVSPICKQRIIVPIPLAVRPRPGGNLLLRIDPRPWFDGVDFVSLEAGVNDVRAIPDKSNGSGKDVASGRAFFNAVTAASPAVYQFSWLTP